MAGNHKSPWVETHKGRGDSFIRGSLSTLFMAMAGGHSKLPALKYTGPCRYISIAVHGCLALSSGSGTIPGPCAEISWAQRPVFVVVRGHLALLLWPVTVPPLPPQEDMSRYSQKVISEVQITSSDLTLFYSRDLACSSLCNQCDFKVEYHKIEKKREILFETTKIGKY